MSEYQLYCFAQSGNAYRVALMLELIGADWEPVFVDYFDAAKRARAEYRSQVNEMGEVPVLVHGKKKLSQSGVCLTYLAERSGKFLPQGEDDRLEAWRWIIFDNQKVNGYLGPYRFLKNFARPLGDPAVLNFLKGRIDTSLGDPRQAIGVAPLHPRRPADHRRHLARRVSLLPGGGIRLRHRRRAQGDRALARSHQGVAGLEASL